ncbi:MAG: helix-turn-helix domain-containing protein, partial [Acidobacteriota bacterium]
YTNVSEMVHAVADNATFADALDKQLAERQVIKLLISLRALADKSQSDLAKAMDCTQSRISKLENGRDGDLRLEDFHAYLTALGYDMKIVIAKQEQTAFDELKYHALSIKRLLDHFAQLAGDDETLAHGVLKAIGETWYNVAKMLEDSARKLKVRPKPAGAIAVEMQEVDGRFEVDCGLPYAP